MCLKCGATQCVEGKLYPWGYKNRRWNRIKLCEDCWNTFRSLRGDRRAIMAKAIQEDSCICCESGYKKEFEAADALYSAFIEKMTLTDTQRKYV